VTRAARARRLLARPDDAGRLDDIQEAGFRGFSTVAATLPARVRPIGDKRSLW
jgi:hypothetical protein